MPGPKAAMTILARMLPAAVVVLTASTALGQEAIAGAEHVHWPLIEIVLVPDSCDGAWVLAAPNLATRD